MPYKQGMNSITNTATGTGTTGIIDPYGNVTIINTQAVGWQTPAGTNLELKGETKTPKKGQVVEIGPRLYFSFLKSKFTQIEKKKLRDRLLKLQALVKDAKELNQQGLYEELAKMITIVAREAELTACGYSTYILKEMIEKFRSKVKVEGKNPIYFKKLEEFPRAFPQRVKEKIKDVKEKKLFDELWVLYLDYTHEEFKPNKEKIKEKDPILFGRFAYQEDKFYYITDWVDEFCDLTLEKFVSLYKEEVSDSSYDRQTIPEINQELLDQLKEEVKTRHERLKNTNRSNYRELMAQEEKDTPKVKVKFWDKMRFWK